MDTKLYVWCAIMGLLGVATQTIIKIAAFQKQAKAANLVFSVKKYFEEDWAIYALNIITLIIALVAVDELIKSYPVAQPLLKWLFVFIGFTGSSLLTGLLSKTQKAITNIVDLKTNMADEIMVNPVTKISAGARTPETSAAK